MSQQRTVEDFAGRRAGSKQGLRQGVDAVGVPVDDGLLELVLHLISLFQATPAARSVSSTMARMRCLISSSSCGG